MLDYKNIGKLFGLNVLNVLLNVAYSTLMVYFYGKSGKVEAFFAASILGTAISRFVQTGQLVEMLVPRYHKTKAEEGKQAAMSIISMMCNYMAGTAFVMVVVFIVSGNFFINLLVPGFESMVKDQVYQIFYITGFLMPIQIATNLFQGMLNAENIYGKVELTNTFSLLTNVIILVIWGASGNINILVAGLVLSVLMQFATTVYYLREVGYRHRFNWQSPYFSLKEMWQTLSATFFYMGGVQVQTFMFNAALSLLPAGMFAIYRYVEVIYGKIANIFMTPLSTVFLNDVNRVIVQKNDSQVRGLVAKNLNFSFLVSLAFLLPFVAGGQYFIWTLWGSSKFDAQDVYSVYLLLIVFFLTMVWNGPYSIYRKLAVSVSRPEVQYYVMGLAQLLSGAVSYVLVRHLQFNGLQLQIAAHTIIMMLIPALTVRFYAPAYFGVHQISEVSKITLAFFAGLLVDYLIQDSFASFETLNKLESLGVGLLQAVIVFVVFAVGCLLLKVEEAKILREKFGLRTDNL